MEGFTKITYKGKEILYVNYSSVGDSKEKTIELIKFWKAEYSKYPPNSILSLVNTTNFHFDKEVATTMKNSTAKAAPYLKKNAVFGLASIHKALYNFTFALTFRGYHESVRFRTRSQRMAGKGLSKYILSSRDCSLVLLH